MDFNVGFQLGLHMPCTGHNTCPFRCMHSNNYTYMAGSIEKELNWMNFLRTVKLPNLMSHQSFLLYGIMHT